MVVNFTKGTMHSLELERINRQIRELQERAKIIEQMDAVKPQLLAFCKKVGATRGDLSWVYHQLPPVRITRASRLRRLAEEAGVGPKPQPQQKRKHPPQHRKLPKSKPEYMPFGVALRNKRKERGMHAATLASTLGVDGSLVTSWERGFWRISAAMMDGIEKALDYKFPADIKNPVIRLEESNHGQK